MRSFTHAWLDEDELQAVIDYHTAMIEQAIDSCEYQEANNRRAIVSLCSSACRLSNGKKAKRCHDIAHHRPPH
jgi:hypothetical protein